MSFKDEVEERLRNLAKPPGSLGLLEEQAKLGRDIFPANLYRSTSFLPPTTGSAVPGR